MKTAVVFGLGFAILGSTSAFAQDLSYGNLGVSLSTLKADGGEVDITAIDGEAGVQFDAFDVFLGATLARLSVSGADEDLDIDTATIGLGYSFGPNYRVDLSHTEIGISIDGDSADTSIQELGFAYDDGTYFGRFAIAKGDDNNDLDELYSLVGGYAFAPNSEVSLSIHFVEDDANTFDDPVYVLKTEYAPGGWGVTLDLASVSIVGETVSLTSLGGHYDITPQITVNGNYAVASVDGDDLSTAMIGVSYDFTENYSVFGNVSQTEFDGISETLDGFTFGFEVDFGAKPTSQETTGERLTSVLAPIAGFSF